MKHKFNQQHILNLIVILFIGFVFLIALIWIIFDFQKSTNSLKESLSIAGSFFGGLATLMTAYIAVMIFNAWRTPQTAQNKSEQAKEVLLSFIKLKSMMDLFCNKAIMYANYADPKDKSVCKILQSDLKKQHYILIMEFEVNLNLYKITYSTVLNEYPSINDEKFNSYYYHINGLFSAIIDKPQPYSASPKAIIQRLENSKQLFEDNFFDPLVKQLSEHIKLNE